MGSSCSTNYEYLEEPKSKQAKLISLDALAEKFVNKIFGFCKSFEENFNLLSSLHLENYLFMVNNFNYKSNKNIIHKKHDSLKSTFYIDDLAKINFIELNHSHKSNGSLNFFNTANGDLNQNQKLKNDRSKTYYNKNTFNRNYGSCSSRSERNSCSFFNKNLMDEKLFSTFVNNKILKNPLCEKAEFTGVQRGKLLVCYGEYLKSSFSNMQQFLSKNQNLERFETQVLNRNNNDLEGESKYNNKKNFTEIPLLLISSIGFNFCESRISKKITLMANMLANSEGLITLENVNLEGFMYVYLQNAILLPVYFLLMETQQNKFFDKEQINSFIGGEENYEKLVKSFFIKNSKTEDSTLMFTRDKDIEINYKREINQMQIHPIFDSFFKNILKLIFGCAGKKALSKKQFMGFLSDTEEGGGFWFLFNEGIRKRFEVFIENQLS